MSVAPPPDGGISVRAALAGAKRRLAAAGIPDPGFEARTLIENLAGLSAVEVLTGSDRLLPALAVAELEAALARRAGGEPLHRILGWREFFGLRLELSPETLEPRPDTETLVEAVLPFARQTVARQGRCRILDLGTGSGAIALALLAQAEGAEAVGVDISAGALATAGANAERLAMAHRFQPLVSDWFEQVSGCFALIVSNPPYIAREELHGLGPEVSRFDPLSALDGGPDGLDAYRILACRSAAFLEPGGRVGLEIGFAQRQAVTELFEACRFVLVEARRDLGGNNRVLVFAAPENAAKA